LKLRPEQLESHLSKQLLPIYVVSGEEPLQREECVDAIRAAARTAHFEEREVFHVDRRFDWNELRSCADTLSLFASRRIVEVRAATKLEDAGRKALAGWSDRPPEDVLLMLIVSFRVDGQMARAKWFSALERAGAHLQVWPVAPAEMPGWVAQRARRAGLALDADAAALLAERAEGNLLAGSQDVEKLALLYRGETVGVEQVLAATADSARYDAFDLVDACFSGDAPRTVRIVRALREEGMRLQEVLGPLAWAMRSAAEIAPATARGMSVEQAMGPRHGAWRAPQRRRALEAVLARHRAPRWGTLLRRASLIDRRSKGDSGRLNWRARGELLQAWGELETLTLVLAGLNPLRG